MLSKEIFTFFLLIGCIEIYAEESKGKLVDKNEEVFKIMKNQDLFIEPKEYFQTKEKWEEIKNKDEIKPSHPFKKEVRNWEGNKYLKDNFDTINENVNHMKINEIATNSYIDKYNKYGNTFNTNLINEIGRKYKRNHHHKEVPETEKINEFESKPRNLLYDTNVNYVNNNKKVSDDSENIPGTLFLDTNVNYVNNIKVSDDSELINEDANSIYKEKENYQQNFQNKDKIFIKREKKNFYHNLKNIDMTNPPSPNSTVLMARYIVHAVDWAAVATISQRAPTKSAPFLCVKTISDGRKNNSTGIPYFYMSPLDLCTQDLQTDNRASVLVTLSETEYCKNNNLDPQDPRCAKLILSGKIKKVKRGSFEEKFAKDALFARHPDMAFWPTDHHWFITKLKIGQVILLDRFGGATYIKVKDYLNGQD